MKLTFCVVGVLLILLILARKSDAGGLASAFGGGGGSEALGVKAGQQLDKVISFMAVILFLLAVLLNVARKPGEITKYTKLNLKDPKTTEEEESK
jgi:protein translocase SecG subunit